VTGFISFAVAAGGLSGARQCGRTGFARIWIQREKSRASIRVASRHAISTAQRNRNQRSNAIPYERCVVTDRPAACSSPKYAATAATGSPEESNSRYGSHGSPVAARDASRETTNDPRSRDRSSLSITGSDHSQPDLLSHLSSCGTASSSVNKTG
jgi:hypothetical protein